MPEPEDEQEQPEVKFKRIRFIKGEVSIGDPVNPDSPEECPGCGFDTLLTFPTTALTPEGVMPLPTLTACPRCGYHTNLVTGERCPCGRGGPTDG